MYITPNRDRGLNVTIAILMLLIIIALIKYQSYALAWVDTHLQSRFIAHDATQFNRWTSILTGSIACGIYAFLLWFVLWGFKHKLIATWLLGTYLVGQIGFKLLQSWVARPRPVGHPHSLTSGSFPSHHAFAIVLLCYLIWIAVFPWITVNWHRWLSMAVMVIICLLAISSRLKLHAAFPVDIIGSLLFTYIWVQIAQELYLHVFSRFQRLKLFRHSDFN